MSGTMRWLTEHEDTWSGVSTGRRLQLSNMSRTKIQDSDREEIAEFVERHWHRKMVLTRGRAFYPHKEEGFVERQEGKIVGLLTFRVDGDELEVLTVNSMLEHQGLGTALMLSAIEQSRARECKLVSLATTNDNIRGLRFYQKIGFRIAAVNVGAVDRARKTKPEIPKIGQDGIPMHDEIIMELVIKPYLDE